MAPSDPGRYLEECLDRLEAAQVGHYLASGWYRRLHYWIGIPAVIAAAVVSSALFTDAVVETEEGATGWAGLLEWAPLGFSLLATILASFQTFLHPNERAEQHRSAATSYGALKRSAEFAQFDTTRDTVDFLQSLVERWELVAATAPVTPQAIRAKVGRHRGAEREAGRGAPPAPPPAPSAAPA